MTDTLRGHQIEIVNNQWVFSDTKELTAATWEARPCGHCGLHNTSEGHDGCLGTLPDVMNACCGHGQTNEAYAQFNDKSILRGKLALLYFHLKGRDVIWPINVPNAKKSR